MFILSYTSILYIIYTTIFIILFIVKLLIILYKLGWVESNNHSFIQKEMSCH